MAHSQEAWALAWPAETTSLNNKPSLFPSEILHYFFFLYVWVGVGGESQNYCVEQQKLFT